MEIEGRHCAFKPCFGRDFVNNHTIQDTARALLPRRMPQSVIPLRTPPTAGLTMTYIRNSIIQFSHPRLSKITYLHPRFHHHPNITQIFFPPPSQSPETKQLPHCTKKNVNQSSKLTTGNKNLIKQKMHHETHTNSSTRNKLHIQTIKNLEININSQKRKIKYLHPGPPPIIPHHQFKVQNFPLHIGKKGKKEVVLPNDKRRHFVQVADGVADGVAPVHKEEFSYIQRMETPSTIMHLIISTATKQLQLTMASKKVNVNDTTSNAMDTTRLQPVQRVNSTQNPGQSKTLSKKRVSERAPGSSSERNSSGRSSASGSPSEGTTSRNHPNSNHPILQSISTNYPLSISNFDIPTFDPEEIRKWLSKVEEALLHLSVTMTTFETPNPPDMTDTAPWDAIRNEVLAVLDNQDPESYIHLVPQILDKIDRYVIDVVSALEEQESLKTRLQQQQNHLDKQLAICNRQIRKLSSDISNAELSYASQGASAGAEVPTKAELERQKAVLVEYYSEKERFKRKQEAHASLFQATAQLQNETAKCHIDAPRQTRRALANQLLPTDHSSRAPPPLSSLKKRFIASASSTHSQSPPPNDSSRPTPFTTPVAPFRSTSPPPSYVHALHPRSFPHAKPSPSIHSAAASTTSSQRQRSGFRIPDDPKDWEWATTQLMSNLRLGRIQIESTQVPFHLRMHPYHQLDRGMQKSDGDAPTRDLRDPDTLLTYETYMETTNINSRNSATGRTGAKIYEQFLEVKSSPLVETLKGTQLDGEPDLPEINWQLTGWSENYLDRQIITLVYSWPITLVNEDVTISTVGADRNGTTIKAANFTTAGFPIHLWQLAKIRSFQVEDSWFHLRVDKYRREQLSNDSALLVYRAQITRDTKEILKPLDMPGELEARLRRHLEVKCIISPPGAIHSWAHSICVSGQFFITFQSDDDITKFTQSKKNYLELLGPAGLGEMDAITGEIEEDLGEYKVKWLWFKGQSTTRAVRKVLRQTGTRYKGIRRSQPQGKGVIYTIGFDTPEDRLQFTMTTHRVKAAHTLFPYPSSVQTVEHYYKVPRGHCFKCYHPAHADRARHFSRDCPPGEFCTVCKEHTHTVEDCSHVPEIATITHRNPANRRRLIPTVNRALSDTGSTRSDRSALSLRTVRFGAMAKRNRRLEELSNEEEDAASLSASPKEQEQRPQKKTRQPPATG